MCELPLPRKQRERIKRNPLILHLSRLKWEAEMRDRLQPDVKLGDELQLNITLMRKADRLKLASPQLADLLTFFEHWQEESIMNQVTSVPHTKGHGAA
jgi:hypothetical protein